MTTANVIMSTQGKKERGFRKDRREVYLHSVIVYMYEVSMGTWGGM